MGNTTAHKFLSSEISLLPKRDKKWSFRVALVFGDKYKTGMANLGFLTVWENLHKFPHIFPQRFFTNCRKSLEEEKKLNSFEIVLASLPYEVNFLNFVAMMRNSEIEPSRHKREGNFPIIILGGCAPTINPLPYSVVADAIFLGQGQEYVEKIIATIVEHPPSNVGREKFLEYLSSIPGIWIPDIQSSPPQRAICKDKFPPVSKVVSSFSAFPNMVLVQIQQGCPFNCPFCATPVASNPFFNYTADSVISSLEVWGDKMSRVGLIGSAVADHPEIDKICLELYRKGCEVYVSSLRLDRIKSHHTNLFNVSAQKTLTFAPETGSARFKSSIGKRFSSDEIISFVSSLQTRDIKLYYIVGLPGESEDDIHSTINEIKEISIKLKHKNISVSVNAFIPKKGTQWGIYPMDSHNTLNEKMKIVSNALAQIGNVKFEANYNRLDRVQWALSCGNEDVGEAVVRSKSTSELMNRLRELGWNMD